MECIIGMVEISLLGCKTFVLRMEEDSLLAVRLESSGYPRGLSDGCKTRVRGMEEDCLLGCKAVVLGI